MSSSALRASLVIVAQLCATLLSLSYHGYEVHMSRPEHNFQMDYIEFPATDVAASKRFYHAVFGWEFKDWGPDYISFHDGRIAGGFSAAAKPADQSGATGTDSAVGPLVVIYATALDDVHRKVTESGGKIVRETFEFPGGKRFHFTDPSGNVLAVWSE